MYVGKVGYEMKLALDDGIIQALVLAVLFL
jgi:hypothetical protein